MKREELEQRIAEASEGELSESELHQLKTELQKWPELQMDFQRIMNLPSLSLAYPVGRQFQFSKQISGIKEAIQNYAGKEESFAEISLLWFKRYTLAASVLIIAASTVLYIPGFNGEAESSELSLNELFVPQEDESLADDYVLYIEDLINE